MNIHVLVEGPSETAFVTRWARRAFPTLSVRVHAHQGKGEIPADPSRLPDPRRRGLLDQLPAKLRAFGASANNAVLVLVDADSQNCTKLKAALVQMAEQIQPLPPVLFRIAVEESEAFYLGDQRAVKSAYPNANLRLLRDYRPDSIVGTAELFGRVIGDGGLNKVAWAAMMGDHLTTDPGKSRSPSFRAFCAAFPRLGLPRLGSSDQQPKSRTKHWKSRHSATHKLRAEGGK